MPNRSRRESRKNDGARGRQVDFGNSAFRWRASHNVRLRYEYALNLVQRVGVSMSRIGLDFTGYKPA